ncbi:MAG: HlyC/CorC family transporter [Sphingomonadaceae bacterium]|nr:HlyC/CorC family transporter [Sphingomonadaceae bacterium]
MPPFPWTDAIIVLALIGLNGFLSMAELAVVSARRPRLRGLAAAGNRGAATALALAERPARFLSSAQAGITLVSILNGAFSGSSLAGPVAQRLAAWGVSVTQAHDLGFGIVIVATTYVSLIAGELVPKQFALRSPEPIACAVAPAMLWLTRLASPFAWVLDRSSALVFRLLGQARDASHSVTEEELRSVVAEAETAGVIEESERQMISGIMRLADRPVRGVMTPRNRIDWLDADASEVEIRAHLAATPHTRLPVAAGSVDDIVGVVQARDVVTALIDGTPLDLRALARPAPVIPDLLDAMDALATLRDAAIPIALVHDEYGHFEGIVTPADLLAAIAGEFRSDLDAGSDPPAVERADGSWLLSGSLPADEMAERLGLDLPAARDYQTVAGFVLDVLRHLPETGEVFDSDGWRFEVVDMDGHKIDKILASCLAEAD